MPITRKTFWPFPLRNGAESSGSQILLEAPRQLLLGRLTLRESLPNTCQLCVVTMCGLRAMQHGSPTTSAAQLLCMHQSKTCPEVQPRKIGNVSRHKLSLGQARKET